jgi:hypothetical protein
MLLFLHVLILLAEEKRSPMQGLELLELYMKIFYLE